MCVRHLRSLEKLDEVSECVHENSRPPPLLSALPPHVPAACHCFCCPGHEALCDDSNHLPYSSLEFHFASASSFSFRACRHASPRSHSIPFLSRSLPLSQHEASGLQAAGFFNDDGEVRLLRKQHLDYVMRGLRYLGPGFICLDASRPWLCYWMLHSIDLLKGLETTGEAAHADVDTELLRHVMTTMASCQNVGGGFGGGTQQLSHCAPTYAAVLALLIVGTEEAYRIIDRPALYRWFLARKHPSGGFCMHDDGYVSKCPAVDGWEPQRHDELMKKRKKPFMYW